MAAVFSIFTFPVPQHTGERILACCSPWFQPICPTVLPWSFSTIMCLYPAHSYGLPAADTCPSKDFIRILGQRICYPLHRSNLIFVILPFSPAIKWRKRCFDCRLDRTRLSRECFVAPRWQPRKVKDGEGKKRMP